MISIFQEDKEQLQKGLGKDAKFAHMTADYVINRIRNAPIAYDVDKFVDKLENDKDKYERLISYEEKKGTVTEEYQNRKAVEILEGVIKIVKAAGVNEQ